MKMHNIFCDIPIDLKTYQYIQRYIDYIENKHINIEELDNKIQIEEIKFHLQMTHCPDEVANQEAINWIQKHAKGFRLYLNSIKLIALIYVTRHLECDIKCEFKKFTFEMFEKTAKDLNILQIIVLNSFFV